MLKAEAAGEQDIKFQSSSVNTDAEQDAWPGYCEAWVGIFTDPELSTAEAGAASEQGVDGPPPAAARPAR